MFCENCGKVISEGSAFCDNCGFKVGNDGAVGQSGGDSYGSSVAPSTSGGYASPPSSSTFGDTAPITPITQTATTATTAYASPTPPTSSTSPYGGTSSTSPASSMSSASSDSLYGGTSPTSPFGPAEPFQSSASPASSTSATPFTSSASSMSTPPTAQPFGAADFAAPNTPGAFPAPASQGGNGSYANGEQKKPGSFLKIGIIIAAVVVVLAVGVYAAVTFLGGGGGGVYSVFNNTRKAYSKELDVLVDKNPVLKSIKSTMSSAYTYQTRFDGGRVTISEDKKAKKLFVEGRVDYPSIRAQLFLTDSSLIVGMPKMLFIEANPKKIADEVNNIADLAGSLANIEIGKATTEILKGIDISYSSLTGNDLGKISADLKGLETLSTNLVKKLIDRATNKEEKTEVEIGGKTQSATLITLTANAKTLKDWMNNDLVPGIKNDKTVKKLIDAYVENMENIGYYGRNTPDYSDIMDSLEESIQEATEYIDDERVSIVVKLKVYKGVIVSAELIVHSDELNDDIIYRISALGDKYRLNDINVEYYDGSGRDPVVIRMEGEHIGGKSFSSNITYSASGKERVRITVAWDTEETNNNIRVRSGGGTLFSASAGLDGKEFTFKYDDYQIILSPLEDGIELPSDAIPTKNLKLSDFEKLFDSFGGGFGGSSAITGW